MLPLAPPSLHAKESIDARKTCAYNRCDSISRKRERERERERESFFSFVYSFVYYSFFVDTRGENDSLRFLCQRTVVSTTVFASPTYFCARACFYFAYSSEYFFLSFDPLFILVAHLVTTATRSPSKSF